MRRTYRDKKLSCGLCKPQKRGMEPKWREKEFIDLKEWDKNRREIVKKRQPYDII